MKKFKFFISLYLFFPIIFLPAETKFINEYFFGLHINNLYNKKTKIIEINKWPTIKFKFWRLWDAGICWPLIQPENRDNFDFLLLDKYVELAKQNSIEVILNLGLTPKWAAKRPHDKSGYGENLTASPPRNIEDWKRYVKEIALRYKGKIKYWEIWNEPDLPLFFTGSIKEMVLLTKEAYKSLKEIDPDNKIISPSVTGYQFLLPWLNMYLKLGGKNYIDIIGTHIYLWFKNDIPEKITNRIEKIKKYKKQNNIEKMPIWNTECGFRKQNVSDLLSAAYIARLSVLQFYYGIEKVIFYSWNNKYIIKMYDEATNTLNETGKAFVEIQKWLIDSKITDLNKKKNIWYATLEKINGKKALMLWLETSDLNKNANFFIQDNKNFKKIKSLLSSEENLKNQNINVTGVPILLYEEGFFD